MAMPTVVCLLPARNCEADLPAYFASVRQFADAVVALDDGSTDGTAPALAAEPLVIRLLRNPPRESYGGWDDAGNRERLLEAAADLQPQWILSLDADERLDREDGAALRQFAESDADRDYAYLMRVFRMSGDLAHYDQSDLWVGRLFAWEPGQRFPSERLHFIPLPTSIPRTRWLRTTLRIQHVASLDESRRRARFEKYRQADPERRFQRDYHRLLTHPAKVRSWPPRPPGLPVLSNAPARPEPEDADGLLSVVVAGGDLAAVSQTLDCLGAAGPEDLETVVVAPRRESARLSDEFSRVRWVDPRAGRRAGLDAARGRWVWFISAGDLPDRAGVAKRVAAHRRGYAMVSGDTYFAGRSRAGWADYLLGHLGNLPGRPAGRLRSPPPRCSYLMDALLYAGGPRADSAGGAAAVNRRLFRLGYGAWRAPEAAVTVADPPRSMPELVRRQVARGRGAVRVVRAEAEETGRFPRRRLARLLLLSWAGQVRAAGRAARFGPPELWVWYRRALGHVALAAASYWGGAWHEALTGGRPSRTARTDPLERPPTALRARRRGES
jgi:glycosyltransferase involved in cell wall biosynthesis